MKNMTLLLICFTFQLQAQNSKVGTIDIDYILSVMPELEQVQQQVAQYKGGLES